jgi:hypothetical protein
MDKLVEIVSRAIADYGFRQVAQWSPDDLVDTWELSPKEAAALKGPIKEELDRLPIPVEPANRSREERRLTAIIKKALG